MIITGNKIVSKLNNNFIKSKANFIVHANQELKISPIKAAAIFPNA